MIKFIEKIFKKVKCLVGNHDFYILTKPSWYKVNAEFLKCKECDKEKVVLYGLNYKEIFKVGNSVREKNNKNI